MLFGCHLRSQRNGGQEKICVGCAGTLKYPNFRMLDMTVLESCADSTVAHLKHTHQFLLNILGHMMVRTLRRHAPG